MSVLAGCELITGLRSTAAENVSGYCPMTIVRVRHQRDHSTYGEWSDRESFGSEEGVVVLTVCGKEASMASASYELLPWAVLSFSLLHKEIHGSLHVFHIQRSALSDQFLDVEIAEPCRTRVIGNIQRVYMRAWPVRLVNKDSV